MSAVLGVPSAAYAQNPIQTENLKTGATDWPLTNPATNHEIEGYASLTSVNRGGQISLFVNTSSATYNFDIYRMGWYGGMGARRMGATQTFSGTAQPACPQDPTTGMTECQWINPAVLTVPGDADPTNWASGIYLVKLTALPSGKQSYITFAVRDDARPSQFLFSQNVTTYHAYNNWGGKSLYAFNSSGLSAVKVSLNRPYAPDPIPVSIPSDPGANLGIGSGEFLHGWEYNAVRWLEKQGYDVTYATSVDLHEQQALLLSHRAYLSFGHNEYWSWEMRANVMNASAQGVNMGFFGANPLYWQIRFETSPVSGAANRTVVCYKGAPEPVSGALSSQRFRDLGMAEAGFVGVMYQIDPVNADIVVTNTSNWVYAGTGLHDGDHLTGLLGYEVDSTDTSTPANAVVLGSSPFPGSSKPSNMTVYTAASGAIVFASGSMQIAWGLDDYGSPASRPALHSNAVEQMFKNILARYTTVVVSPSTTSVAQGQTRQFTAAVTGLASTAVTWSVNPAIGSINASGLYTAPAAVTIKQTLTVTATSVSDPTHKATATITLTPSGTAQFLRVHAGGGAYTDSLNQAWSADAGFTGGGTDSAAVTIANTNDPTLYQYERWGTFTYDFAVVPGNYTVTLKFAEIYFTAANKRLFNVRINGATVLTNFDIYAQAGGANRAVDRTFTISAATGAISIQFYGGNADIPKVSAIEIASTTAQPPVVVTVSPGTASLAAGQTQQFTASVSGPTNTSVIWSVSPAVGTVSAAGLYTAPGSIATLQTVTVTATSVADPTKSASATVTLNPPGSFPAIRVNVGGPAYTDSLGQAWTADSGFSGGTTASTTSTIANTTDQTLYKTERWGAFTYTFAAPAGSYLVTLKFAESVFTAANQRLFGVAINGTTVLSNFDIFTQAGGMNRAFDQTFNVTSTGTITIQFISGTADDPKVDAIQIVGAGPQVATPAFSPMAGTYTATQSVAITDATAGASIYYTLDGTTPTAASTPYTSPIAVAAATTIKAIAVWSGVSSAVATAAYTLQAATPTFSPVGGTYPTTQTVSLADTSAGAQIYYTINGTTPTAASTPYSGPITVAATTTIKAIAVVTGWANSAVASATYTIAPVTVAVAISPTSATLTAGATQQFTATVTGNANTAVTWSLGPAVGTLSTAGLYTAPSPIASQQTVTVTATSVADPTKSANATVTLNPPSTFAVRVNVGGPAYTDSLGQAWTADSGFSGGTTASTTSTITNTNDQTLYKTERWGAFTYTFAAPAGSYLVTLKFAESVFTAANQRLFSVAINGTTVLSNFDIFTRAGGMNRAFDQTFTVTSTGTITIQFISGTADDPKVDAIQIVNAGPQVATPVFTPAGGTYTAAQSAAITDATSGAQIYYTLDNSTPTSASTPYTSPIAITAATTIKAVAVLSGVSSTVATAAYALQAATPTFSPVGGTYPTTQTVSLADTSAGAQIYYTIDGTAPTAASTPYGGPVTVATTTTIKAIAVVAGWTNSAVASATYTIAPVTVAVAISPTSATLTAGATQQFTATVTGNANTAVTWSLGPAVGTLSTAGLYTAPSPIASQQTVTVTATSVADPTKSASATVTLNPPSTFAVRVNVGGPAYTDSLGQAWAADSGFSGGTTASTTSTIANTNDQTLYKTERWGAFTYSLAAAAGNYLVTLKFAESVFTAANQRLFSVAINGTTVLSNFDIFTRAGGMNRAFDQTFTVTSTGTITVQFISGSADDPKVDAIEIVAGSGSLVAAPLFSPAGGTYSSAQSVTITDATAGASIYYTLDGATPSASSTPYGGPIAITTGKTIKAVAVLNGTSSAVATAVYTLQTATPTFSPAGGTYSAAQTVSLSDTSAGAQIYYTTNGTTPTAASTPYAGPIAVTATTTIKAIAVVTGWTNSAVASATYTLTAATPTFSPVAGTYSANQSVTLSSTSAGAKIYYTTNGSTPTTASTLYSAPIAVTATTTIKTIAVVTGWTNSAVASATFTLKVATPTFTPVAGTYAVGQQVTITDASAGAKIYYTTNGTTPTTASTLYAGPITLGASTTVKAIAVITGWSNSAVATAIYTIQ